MADRLDKGERCQLFERLLEQVLRELPRHLSEAFLESAHAQTCLTCQETYAQVCGHVIIACQRTQRQRPSQ